MADINFGRIKGENQLIFLGTGQIIANSLDITSNLGSQTLRYLGIGNKTEYFIPNSEQSADVTIAAELIKQDNFLSLTGANPINMFILQDKNDINNNYCLISGYLLSYSAKFGINQIPQINAEIKFYNNAGKIPTGSLGISERTQLNQIKNNNYTGFFTTGLLIPYANSINLTLDEYNSNRIQDFNINLSLNRIPIYNVGNRSPIRVDRLSPINATCQFSFEAGGGVSGYQLQDFPQNKKIQNISLQVNSYDNNQLIQNYSFNDMNLINETYNTTTDGNVIINRSYAGYIKI